MVRGTVTAMYFVEYLKLPIGFGNTDPKATPLLTVWADSLYLNQLRYLASYLYRVQSHGFNPIATIVSYLRDTRVGYLSY